MKPLRFNYVVPAFWLATIGLATALLAKGAQSVLYGVRFPDHAMFLLLFLIVVCWLVTGPRELAAFRCFARTTRKKASTISVCIRSKREARSLASLFTAGPFNHPQTEP